MLFRILAVAAVGLFCMLPQLHAGEVIRFNNKLTYRQTFSKATPPIGFIDFCRRNPNECLPADSTTKVSLTEERWRYLSEVNAYVNSIVEPRSDQELYGVPERWDYPTTAGDCEDYALLKKRYLERLGFSAGALLLTVVFDEAGRGHAVLMVLTEERGDFVLDNRRNEVLLWSETKYRFVARQSQEDPQTWIALSVLDERSLVRTAQAKRRK